jgi:multicomponent Na+:H+ antiporter subunit D
MAAPSSITPDYTAAMIMQPVAASEWLIVLPFAVCIVFGAILMMVRHSTWLHARIALTGLVLLVAVDAALLWKVATEGPFTMVMGRWLPPFGIAFTADLTGVLLAFAAALSALACGLYSLSDIDENRKRYGFYPFLMLLMAGVSGAFLTGDIFNLYVWFEVLLISSFGLLVLGSEREQIDGALKYAVLNLIGTTLFLITVGYLYAIFGTLNMADIVLKAGEMRGTAPMMTLACLFTLAFAMKSAAFPVNFWLPASYHTPKIVVAALFGGLLTKVGVYSLLRVMVMLFPVERQELSLVIAIVAALTMVLGALGALAQNDIRRMMGYVVVSGIGYMMAGIAIGTVGGISGAVFYAAQSVLLMTALYLVVGIVARMAGTWSLSELGGLYKLAPLFSGLALALFFAGAGLPPFVGFWPKAMLVKAAIDIDAWWLAGSILVSGFLVTLAFGRLYLLAFWRPKPQKTGGAQVAVVQGASSGSAISAIIILALIIVVGGILPESIFRLSQQAAEGLVDPAAYIRSVFPEGSLR